MFTVFFFFFSIFVNFFLFGFNSFWVRLLWRIRNTLLDLRFLIANQMLNLKNAFVQTVATSLGFYEIFWNQKCTQMIRFKYYENPFSKAYGISSSFFLLSTPIEKKIKQIPPNLITSIIFALCIMISIVNGTWFRWTLILYWSWTGNSSCSKHTNSIPW